MFLRGIRGATTVTKDEEPEILQATAEMLNEIIQVNGIQPDMIGSVFITVTQDLKSTFPARAIRQLPGWELVPLMCSVEIPVENSLSRCIRLMVMVNTEKNQDEMIHVYLNEAKSLRPDLAAGPKC
ncbi:chorismate mutase [Ferviditalea candida]|uniref:chorismate mutase n=1 Tax=Ferviditalea candida TaxID=3108399 RepID=A0ABU5ZNS1_9BACL|nr:chorismate mutase [Paenibacillaceae bacterium T2]